MELEMKSMHGDEYYTLYEHAIVITKSLRLPEGSKLWLPFNDKGRAFEKACMDSGYVAVCTDSDFFCTEPPEGISGIVSNPPFSRKKEVVQRCKAIGVKFALILPMLWLSSGVPFDYGYQVLFWRKRVRFEFPGKKLAWPKGSAFVLSDGLLKHNYFVVYEEKYWKKQAIACGRNY